VALATLVAPQVLLVLVQGVAPLLLRRAPLLLLALHPVEPWSVLVAARTDVLPFVAIVVVVRSVPACGGYLVGRWYGPAALDRLSDRVLKVPRLARISARVGRTSSPALLLIYPGATASVLAGAGRLRGRVFLPLMLAGLVLGAVVSRTLAGLAAGPVTAVSGFLERHAATAGAVLLVAAVLLAGRGRRHRAR
jgi:membrane protein DedA with SNARE-associated domain